MKVGIGTYGHENIKREGTMNEISIGNFCSIAENVVIDGGFNHNTNFVSTFPFLNRYGSGAQNVVCKGDVNIGNDVWISRDVIIMSGITIGDGAVIGAKSIVTRNVPPYTIVAGCPARKIKQRFTDEQIDKLLALQWWNWPIEKVLSEMGNATDIETFLKKHT